MPGPSPARHHCRKDGHRLPRGILLASGDSVRIGEAIPDVPAERATSSRPRLLTSPVGAFAAASQVEVDLDKSGRVAMIFVSFPSGTDYAALVARVREELGAPTSATENEMIDMTWWTTRLLHIGIMRRAHETHTTVTAMFHAWR